MSEPVGTTLAPVRASTQNRSFTVLRYGLTLGLVAMLPLFVDMRVVGHAIAAANGWLFAAATLVSFVAFGLTTAKWLVLLRSRSLEVGFMELMRLNLVAALYATVLPGQVAGEGVKIVRLLRRDSDRATFVASVLVDRVTGLLGLCVLGVVGSAASRGASSSFWLLTATGVGLVTVIAVIGVASRMIGRRPSVSRTSSIGTLLGRFRTVLVAVNTFRSPPSTLVVAVSISIVFQALLTVVVFLLSKSLGLEIPIMDLAWIFAVASVAQMLPVSVAGIGMREGTIVYLLGQQGVSAPDALALSLLILTGNLIVAAIGAFSELWTTDQGKAVATGPVG